MLIRDTTLTPALARWLRESHDDDESELLVAQVGTDIVVMRLPAARDLSETERLEITARLAAHAVEPLT